MNLKKYYEYKIKYDKQDNTYGKYKKLMNLKNNYEKYNKL